MHFKENQEIGDIKDEFNRIEQTEKFRFATVEEISRNGINEAANKFDADIMETTRDYIKV